MIPLKSEEDLRILSEAGRILAGVIQRLEGCVRPGVSTAEVSSLAEELICQANCRPAFKGYRGYPAAACVSLNEEVVHGIPGPRIITDGDIVSIDVGIEYEGYFVDSAVTLPVGKVESRTRKLIEVTRKALSEGIRQARVNNRLFDISYAVQRCVEKNGFSVVRDFVGHGIGRELHEEPEIPNFGQPRRGIPLKKGMVLAIEPMVNMGGWETRVLDNGWTAVTKDGTPSAHFEHTIAITDEGPKILTHLNG
ncbi:MAG: type I methionyl aminopeptidase [Candidatus Omnitrophota bacterium]